jgi:predicted DNA-binding protein
MADTEKWKSVLVPIDVYHEIKNLSKNEGRTITGQLRLMFEQWKQMKPKTKKRL